MAMESLTGVMSVQAQSTAANAKKYTAPAEKTEEAVPAAVQEVTKVDKTINVVDEAKNKGQTFNNDTAQEQPREQAASNTEQIRKAVERLNRNMAHSEAVFGIHEGTNRVMIKIVDRDTKEVIKELPPEKTLDMIAKVWEMAGILVDEKR